MSGNEISYKIRGAIFKVFNFFGPGLLESAYESALTHELQKEGLTVARQVHLPLVYDGVEIEGGYRMDMVVDKKVLIEIKSVSELHEIHHKQTLTYLKLSGIKLGILVNFNTMKIDQSIFRKVNNL
jgi:GxxExxY protein